MASWWENDPVADSKEKDDAWWAKDPTADVPARAEEKQPEEKGLIARVVDWFKSDSPKSEERPQPTKKTRDAPTPIVVRDKYELFGVLDDAIASGATEAQISETLSKNKIDPREFRTWYEKKEGIQPTSQPAKPAPVPDSVRENYAKPTGQILAQDPSLVEDVVNIGKRGLARAGLAKDVLVGEAARKLGLNADEATARAVSRRMKDISNAPMSMALQDQIDAIGSPETMGETFEAIRNNPVGTVALLAESVIASSPSILAGLGGAALGPAGAAGGAYAVSSAMEYANTLVDAMRDKGIDPGNPVEFLQAYQDASLMEDARQKGLKRGITIGAFDAITAGLAGRFISPALQAIEAGTLKGGRAVGSVLARGAAETGVQMVGGAGGEAAAQALTGEYKPLDIALEALAEIPSVVPEAGSNILYARRRTEELAAQDLTRARIAEQLRAAPDAATAAAAASELSGSVDALTRDIDEYLGRAPSGASTNAETERLFGLDALRANPVPPAPPAGVTPDVGGLIGSVAPELMEPTLPTPTLPTPALPTEADRMASLRAMVDRDAERMAQGLPPDIQVPEVPWASPSASAPTSATPEASRIASLRSMADRNSELLAQADGAGTAFDRQMALDQAQTALDLKAPPRRETPRYADLAPMTEQQATQRLGILRDMAANEGGDALQLAVVPHPAQAGKFAIGEQTPPSLDLPAEPARAIPAGEAQARIESAAMVGEQTARRAEDAPRLTIVDRALANIDARGGVASPYEAEVLRQANAGQPYDRVDPSLGRSASVDEKLSAATGIAVGSEAGLGNRPRTSQTLQPPTAPFEYDRNVGGQRRDAQELPLVEAVPAFVNTLRREDTPAARAFVRDYEAGRITDADVQTALDVQRRGAQTPSQIIEQAAAQAPRAQGGVATETASTPRPISPALAEAVTLYGGRPYSPSDLTPEGSAQRLATAASIAPTQQSAGGVQIEQGASPRGEFGGRQDAVAEANRALPPRPQRIQNQPTSQLSDAQLQAIASNEALPAISRRGASIELDARRLEQEARGAGQRRDAEQADVQGRLEAAAAQGQQAATAQPTADTVLATAAAQGRLSQPSAGRIVTSSAKLSTQRQPIPGSTGTLNDVEAVLDAAGREVVDPATGKVRTRPVTHDYTVVDAGSLGMSGRLVQQVARIFGKRVAIFKSETLKADGFVLDGDNRTVYLNASSQISPMAVFGHELTHLMKRENGAAYTALKTVVERQLRDGAMAEFGKEYGVGANLEELSSDLVGNRFQESGFWRDVFLEIGAQQSEGARGAVLKLANSLNKAINAFLKVVRQGGYRADRYVRDLNAVKAAVKQATVEYAQTQRDAAIEMDRDGVGASGYDSGAFTGAQNARFSGAGRGQGLPGDAGQDGRGAGQDGRGEVPVYGQAREGAVSVVGRHYSREQRSSLSGQFYGQGIRGNEQGRLANSADPRLRQRVYFYVDTGNGIRPESGVGSYAHEVRLQNIYDPASRLIEPQADANAFESAVLNAGFDGYVTPFGNNQSAVVLLGPKHRAVPVRAIGQPSAAAPSAGVNAAPTTLKKGLLTREINAIDLARVPGALLRNGNLEIPADQRDAANAELERIGSSARFSKSREPAAAASARNENRVSVVVGAKPGEFNWSFSAKDTPVPPFAVPAARGPRLEKVGTAVHEILVSSGFRKLAQDAFGIKNLRVVPLHGSWLNKPEPSFSLYADNLTFDQADALSRMLGFAFAQDATVVYQPTSDQTPGEIPAVYVGANKKLSPDQLKAVLSSAQAEGLDYSTTADGKAVKFLHFGDEEGLVDLVQKTARIAEAAGLQAPQVFYVRSQLNEADSYTKGTGGGDSQAVWFGDREAGPSSLFRRTVDHVLVPYAKAVGAEGYRFAVQRFAERFGLDAAQQEVVRNALIPRSGLAKSTAGIASGEVKLDIVPTGKKGKQAKVSVNDILWALQNYSAQAGLIEPGDYSPRAKKVIAEALADEVVHHVTNSSSGKSAIGWYDRALKAAKAAYAGIFPEIAADPDRSMLFDAVLGIASQGNDVFANSIFAGRVYQLVREGNTLSDAVRLLRGTFGEETRAIENNLLKLEQLLNRNGYAAMRTFFNRKDTVSAINARLRADTMLHYNGKPLGVDGAAEQRVTGWMVFGPKIGSFINNLHGDYSTLTADLWFSRTWNRILGYSFVHTPALEAEQYQTFLSALLAEYAFSRDVAGPIVAKSISKTGKVNLPEFGQDANGLTDSEIEAILADPDAALAYAGELEAVYRKGNYKEKSDLRRAAKNWIENRQESVAAPRTDRERAFQQSTVEAAQKIIKRRTGMDITIADIQAALWYYEKDDLFKALGGTNKKSEAADYSGAAEQMLDLYNRGDLFFAKTDGRYVHGAKGYYLGSGSADASTATLSRQRNLDEVSRDELAGRRVKIDVRVEDSGETASLTMDAKDALDDVDERESVMQRLLECLA